MLFQRRDPNLQQVTDTTVAVGERLHFSLTPGYYAVWIARTQRCWETYDDFVVARGLNRDILLEPGEELPPGGDWPVLSIDYLMSGGLVLHLPPQISKVMIHGADRDGFALMEHAGSIWYADYPGTRTAKLRFYVGRNIVRTTSVQLEREEFVELFYDRQLIERTHHGLEPKST